MVGVQFNGVATRIGGNGCRLAIFLNEPFDFINIHCVRNAKVGITTGFLRRRDGLSTLQHHLYCSITTRIMNGVLHCLHSLRENGVAENARPMCAHARWFKTRNEWVGNKNGPTAHPFISACNTRGVVLNELLKVLNRAHEITCTSRVRRHHESMGQFHSAHGDGLKKHFILRHGHPLMSAYLVFSARDVTICGTYRAENTFYLLSRAWCRHRPGTMFR